MFIYFNTLLKILKKKKIELKFANFHSRVRTVNAPLSHNKNLYRKIGSPFSYIFIILYLSQFIKIMYTLKQRYFLI